MDNRTPELTLTLMLTPTSQGALVMPAMTPLTTLMMVVYNLSSIPLLKGKSNALIWLWIVKLQLRACRIWHLCKEGVIKETLEANQSIVDWLTPSLIARMANAL